MRNSLSTMDIDTLSGRALDRAVGEQVMGMEIIEGPRSWAIRWKRPCSMISGLDEAGALAHIPNYTRSDGSQFWLVVERMRERGWGFHLSSLSDGRWHVVFDWWEVSRGYRLGHEEGRGAGAAEATCRAALHARAREFPGCACDRNAEGGTAVHEQETTTRRCRCHGCQGPGNCVCCDEMIMELPEDCRDDDGAPSEWPLTMPQRWVEAERLEAAEAELAAARQQVTSFERLESASRRTIETLIGDRDAWRSRAAFADKVTDQVRGEAAAARAEAEVLRDALSFASNREEQP